MKGSISRRGTAWRIHVHVGYTSAGKRKVLTRTVHGSKKEAESEMARMILEAERLRQRTGGPAGDADTLGGWLGQWMQGRAVAVSPTTVATQARLIRLHIAPALGTVKLRGLTGAKLTAHYAALLENGLAPATVGGVHALLSTALKQAEREGLIADAPTRFAHVPKARAPEIQVPTHETIAKVLQARPGHWVTAAALLILSTGLRRGECIALRWEEIDLDAGMLRVRRNAQTVAGAVVVLEPKTAAGRRDVRLPDELTGHLRTYRLSQRRERLERGLRPLEELVFPNKRGQLQKPQTFSKAFEEAGHKVGVAFGPHLLRHRHATDLMQAGLGPRVAQERLGHARVTTTMELYQHVLETSQQKAAEVGGEVLRAVTIGLPKGPTDGQRVTRKRER